MLIGTGLVGAGALAAAGGFELYALNTRHEPRMFGVSVEGSSDESVAQIRTLDTRLSRKLNVVNIYVAWGWERPFPSAAVAAISSLGAVPELTWEPWRPDYDKRDQPDYTLSALQRHDDYAEAFALACAQYAKPIYLRFAHEMNSDWYPWSVSLNGNTPTSYAAAYRRLHQQFQAAGATNVRWVWCPNVIYKGRSDLIADSYPGDDVVDVVALDGYNRGTHEPSSVFGPSLALLKRIAPEKPLWINEVGTVGDADDGRWIKKFFRFMAHEDVACVVWFEVNKPSAPDWRLMRTSSTADAAREALKNW